MPDSLDPQFAAAPLPLSSNERHAVDETELVRLRATVVDLLEEIKRGANSVMPVPDMDGNGMALIRFAQAVSNLLINASQFTPTHARIGISAVCRDEMIDITVSDNGAGIPLALQPYIFDLFTQGHRTLERALGGLGLGLALVQTIVRMHGGSVAVKSDGAGTGSSFTISLPLAPAASPPLQSPATQAAAMRNILIIEDNVDANEIMAILLSMQGHQVTSSFHGADGLRLALDGQFDVVVCDLGLPGLSGLEVAAAIKASHQGAAPVVIAMSGYTDSSQRDLARAAGFDHYLTKPVDLALLYQLIAGNAK